jgi:hypothetical protein
VHVLVHPILTQSKSNQIPCTCVWGNIAHVSTILPLDIAVVFDGVVYLVIHVINQIMNA